METTCGECECRIPDGEEHFFIPIGDLPHFQADTVCKDCFPAYVRDNFLITDGKRALESKQVTIACETDVLSIPTWGLYEIMLHAQEQLNRTYQQLMVLSAYRSQMGDDNRKLVEYTKRVLAVLRKCRVA